MASVEVGQSGSGNATMKVRVNYTPGGGGVTVTSIDAYRDKYGPTTGNATMYFNGTAITTKSMTWPATSWGTIWSGSAWVGGTSLSITFTCGNNNNIKNSVFSTGVYDSVNEYYVGFGSGGWLELMAHRTYLAPTWSDAGVQDDIVWHKLGGGYWERGGRAYECAWGGYHNNASWDDAWTTHWYGHGSYIGYVRYYPRINIYYNANGGSSTPGTQTKYIGNAMYLAGAISRTGYSFQGWSDTNTGGAKWGASTYLNCHTWNSLGGDPSNEGWRQTIPGHNGNNITLYAIWSINSYYIDLNGTLDGTSSGNVAGYATVDVYVPNNTKVATGVTDYYTQHTYGTTYKMVATATKGHHFTDGTTTQTKSGTLGAGTADVRFAIDTNTYTIKYDANGGSGAPSNQTKTYGTNLVLSSTKPTRSGYLFLGWSTNKSATSATYTPGATLSTELSETHNATVTLYAIWREKQTKININGTWKGADTVYLNIGGTWKTATVYIKVDGTWKQLT